MNTVVEKKVLGNSKAIANPFAVAKAKEKETPSKSTKKEYTEVVLSEDEYPMVSQYLTDLEQVREELEGNKTLEKDLSEEVKAIAKRAYVKLYAQTKKNPSTFIIRGENGGKFMVLPTERYAKVTASKAEYLRKQYGEETVQEDTTFKFDPAILNKGNNLEIIGRAIMESELSDEDKSAILEATTTYTVAKGTIDRMADNPQQMLNDIEPVFQLKNCQR